MANDIRLTPGVIQNGSGEYMAPKTFSELVYMSDGNTLDNVIEDIYTIDRSCVVKSKTYSILIEKNKQKVFDNIPTPIDNYDLEKGVLFILDTNKKLINSSAYIVDMESKTINFNISSVYNNFIANDLLYLIYVYADNAVTGGDYSVSVVKKAITIEEQTKKVSTGLTFTKGIDTFLVYKNSIYIEEEVDYDLASNGNTIILKGENETFNVGDILNFILISNSNKKVVSLKSTTFVEISSPTNITTVPIKIPEYSRSTDSLFVYMNGTYLEVDHDYYISSDSKYIRSTSSGFQVASQNVRFDFVVFKNICNYTDIESTHTNEESENLLDNSTGYFGIENEWDTTLADTASVIKDQEGANVYSTSIAISSSNYAVGNVIMSKKINGKFNHKEYLTIQAKVKYNEGAEGNLKIRLHSISQDREILSNDFVIKQTVISGVTKNKWFEYSATGQVLLVDDLKNLTPSELKLEIIGDVNGTFKISEIKVTRGKTVTKWNSSQNDINRTIKLLTTTN